MALVKKRIAIPLILVGTLVLGYYAGPVLFHPKTDLTPVKINISLNDLDSWIAGREDSVSGIKEDNQARVVWFKDSLRRRTRYSLVYLHGFSASQGEGEPVHRYVANAFGMNLFLARLSGHGIDSDEAFENLSPDAMIESSKDAIAIGKIIGEKVIVMGTSTGGTLALALAAADPEIAALILYSPNVSLYDRKAPLAAGPWGRRITRGIVGGDFYEWPIQNKMDSLYWTHRYRIEGLIALQSLVDHTMIKSIFNQVTQPVFLGYYYKNEDEQDKTVSVPAMLEMYQNLGTLDDKKRKVAFPDAGHHVIAGQAKSKDWEAVLQASIDFNHEILQLEPVDTSRTVVEDGIDQRSNTQHTERNITVNNQ